MKNQYLDILELQPGATEKDIKAAYRRLSKIYHPDISKDENAKEKFIKIAEAYNFLIKVGPNPNQETTSYDYNPFISDYELWRKQAQAKARQKAREQARLQDELIMKMLKGFDYAALAIVVFNLLLVMDYLLPLKAYEQNIIKMSKIYQSAGVRGSGATEYAYDDIEFEDFTVRFDKGTITFISDNKATVFATRIFKKPMAAILMYDGSPERYDQSYNVYNVFGYLIPIIFLIIGLYRYAIKTLDAKLTLAIFMAFLFLFQLYMFFKY